MAGQLPVLAAPTPDARSLPFQVGDFSVSHSVTLGRRLPRAQLQKHRLGLLILPLGTRVRDQGLCRYEAEPSRCPWPGSRRPQRVGTGLQLSHFQVLSDIYSGARVWLGAFASKAQEWGYKKENGGEQKNTISGS